MGVVGVTVRRARTWKCADRRRNLARGYGAIPSGTRSADVTQWIGAEHAPNNPTGQRRDDSRAAISSLAAAEPLARLAARHPPASGDVV
jgi:hypothetical protein